MDDGPDSVDETTRTALPRAGRRDEWLEQRLSYPSTSQARLKGGVPLRRFLRGATAAYRRFLLTADPAHRFHCGATVRTLEPRGWTKSSAGQIALKWPDPHRTARTRDKHWRRV